MSQRFFPGTGVGLTELEVERPVHCVGKCADYVGSAGPQAIHEAGVLVKDLGHMTRVHVIHQLITWGTYVLFIGALHIVYGGTRQRRPTAPHQYQSVSILLLGTSQSSRACRYGTF